MRDPFTPGIERRRRHIPDRPWIGMGMIVAGLFGAAFNTECPTVERLLGAAGAAIGVGTVTTWFRDRLRSGGRP